MTYCRDPWPAQGTIALRREIEALQSGCLCIVDVDFSHCRYRIVDLV